MGVAATLPEFSEWTLYGVFNVFVFYGREAFLAFVEYRNRRHMVSSKFQDFLTVLGGGGGGGGGEFAHEDIF